MLSLKWNSKMEKSETEYIVNLAQKIYALIANWKYMHRIFDREQPCLVLLIY